MRLIYDNTTGLSDGQPSDGQAFDDTVETSGSIDELTVFSRELQEWAAGFQLPERDQETADTGSIDRTVEFTPVKLVLKELMPMLNEVKRAIVGYVEAPEYANSMEGVAGMLRKIHGTVQMLELYGAEMLAEEMHRMVEELNEEKLSNRDEALEVLKRSALQLPDFLERIKAGNPDMSLALLPLLNDMRAARGETLLSDTVLVS